MLPPGYPLTRALPCTGAALRLAALMLAVALVALWPAASEAQEATIAGIVTDATGARLPGVSIVATHEATGHTFEAVTDERGAYLLLVRTGAFRLAATLDGFGVTVRDGIDVRVGQVLAIPLHMAPAGVSERVTVSGSALFTAARLSRPAGNIDPTQMQELPVNGRDFLNLALLAPGNRANAATTIPLARDRGDFQINLDGQPVTATTANRGQPTFGRDAIAEFEFVAGRFDATQGRSSGAQLNVVTKSGTNTWAGLASAYARDDRFSAADFIQGRVLPYSDQQYSVSAGGPIRKDRVHIFANREDEREPMTFAYSSPYPRFNIDQGGTRTEHKDFVRLDVAWSSRTRLTARLNTYDHPAFFEVSSTGGAAVHPSSAITFERHQAQAMMSLTRVVNHRAVNEVKGGWQHTYWFENPVVRDAQLATRLPGSVQGNRVPSINLNGYRIGSATGQPSYLGQDSYWLRDDMAVSYSKGGRHDLRIGGEFLHTQYLVSSCATCMGVIEATGGPIPSNIEALFPVWNDPSTWNEAALSPITQYVLWTVGNMRQTPDRQDVALWVQDDWAVSPRLTMNLGVRYDLGVNWFANALALPPFLEGGRPNDRNNVGPRVGVALRLNDRTVLRGGFGKYFGNSTSVGAVQTYEAAQRVQLLVPNDGRPDFAVNPFNGPAPSYEQAVRSGIRRSILDEIVTPDSQVPHSYQASAGLQRLVGTDLTLTADYRFAGDRNAGGFGVFTRNINLNYNPDTRANYPYTDVSHLPYPDWGPVEMEIRDGRSNYHALEATVSKRMSHGWQASGNYTLSGLWDADPVPNVPFAVAPDIGGEYTLARTDQRHRAVVNSVWQMPLGFQVSGLYFYGSGQRFARTYSGDLRQMGIAATNRLRRDGTIVPRNGFVGRPIHRVDLRVSRPVRLGRLRAEGMVEVFNLLNHANYGAYVTNERSASFGEPSAVANVAYKARLAQFGLRVVF